MIPLILFVAIVGSVMLLYGCNDRNIRIILIGFITMMLSIIVLAK